MNKLAHKILLLGRDRVLLDRINEALSNETMEVETTETVKRNSGIEYQLVFIEGKSDFDLASFKEVNAEYPMASIIIVCDSQTKREILPFVKNSVFDILDNECDENEIYFTAERAIKMTTLKSELLFLKQQVAMDFGFDNLVGESSVMKKVKESISKVAPTDITILLTGEKGTGKKLTARIIHHHSQRRKKSMVTMECGAIPEILLEQELFGDSTNIGLLKKADGGTLFLNDVDKLSKNAQKRLSDFMFDFTLREDSGETKVDVRIISATTEDMRRLIAADMFSESLYNQLNVIAVNMPPLSKRQSDIEHLVEYFCRKTAFDMNKRSIKVTPQALEMFLIHEWENNVMELENTVKRAAALTTSDTIESSQVIFLDRSGEVKRVSVKGEDKNVSDSSGGNLEEGQRRLILKALNKNDWNYTHTAQELGIGRTTLWRKVKKYKLNEEVETV